MRNLSEATKAYYKPIRFNGNEYLQLSLNEDGTKFIAQFSLLHSDTLYRPSGASAGATTKFLLRVVERKQVVSNDASCDTYEFAATDFTANAIHHLWPADSLHMDDEAKLVYDYLLAQGTAQDLCADVTAAYKENKEVPPHSYEMDADKPLKGYQQVALYNAMHSDGYALFMEQGTGKTPITVARICNEIARKSFARMHRTLIVCPKNVRMNWQSEINVFATRKLHTVILRGTDLARTKQLIEALVVKDCEGIVVIISYEVMTRMWNRLKAIQWDLSILDEGHYIKRPETKRSKTSRLLRDVSDKRMLLTGTPITNTPLDLYAEFEFLAHGGSGFHSWSKFREFYGVFKKEDGGGRQRNTLVGVQNMPFIQERLARVSFSISKKEALPDLPEIMYDVLEVEMSAEQSEAYDSLCKHLAFEIESELSSNTRAHAVVINNILTMLLRLAQVTSGFLKYDAQYSDDGEVLCPATVRFFKTNPKLDMFIEELKTRDINSKTIVWCYFTPDIHALHDRLKLEGIDHELYYGATSDKDREIAEYRFNCDPDCRVLVGNAGAGGTGLNLLGYDKTRPDDYETNADWTVYYSQGWSPTARWQSESRGHRNGTRVPMRVTDLCVPQTIDEEIRARVLQKKLTADSINDIREILKNVLYGA